MVMASAMTMRTVAMRRMRFNGWTKWTSEAAWAARRKSSGRSGAPRYWNL